MTTPSDKPRGGPLSFAFGILFGVAATFLFGTDEGRKLVKKLVDSFPNPSLPPTTPLIFPEETRHHATFEPPPPPEPKVRPTRPVPFKPTL